ncbi:hypothetical protein M5689_017146 [Euphorbia peplus]|nr:hypothetical protein M5689_017146 [Euphorbia peplus]
MGLFDLETQFAFYGAYHSNPINVLIHLIFVWPIFFTALMLFYFTPYCVSEIETGGGLLLINFGFFFALAYALFYVGLDKKAGSVAAVLCFACWVAASFLAAHLGFSLAWKVVLAAQVFCWSGQLLGHGIFEKRAPALLDNLTQAFLMAPFFVLLEILEKTVGYEPYPGFHAKVKAKVDADIKEWRNKKQKKST